MKLPDFILGHTDLQPWLDVLAANYVERTLVYTDDGGCAGPLLAPAYILATLADNIETYQRAAVADRAACFEEFTDEEAEQVRFLFALIGFCEVHYPTDTR